MSADDARSGHAPRHAWRKARRFERLRRAGFAGPGADGVLVLKGEPRILAFFRDRTSRGSSATGR
jgi:hypothetical protein